MPCYHPLFAYSPINDALTDKQRLVFLGYDSTAAASAREKGFDVYSLPCGKCIGCRLDYSREWANRCMLELKYHDSAYFVTLTYNDAHIPRTTYLDSDGQEHSAFTLCKRDFQLFMKRLRKAFPSDKIRFYAAGEYGDKSHRPHYHAILFGLHLHDLKPFGKNFRGEQYFTSQSLLDVWSVQETLFDGSSARVPIGNVSVGAVSWDSCSYVARYVVKKAKDEANGFYDTFNLVKPFCLMSRRPGIGRQFLDDNPDVLEKPFIVLPTEKKGLKMPVPDYFLRVSKLTNPDLYDKISLQRKYYGTRASLLRNSMSSLSEEQRLEISERSHESRTKSLERSL